MKSFDYVAPATLPEACEILSEYGPDATILAGGTDLLIEARRPSMNAAKLVVDICSIAGLDGITESDGHIVIGPLTTHARLQTSSLLHRFAPLLSSAAATIGSPQIRNRGTIGGNLMNAAPCADTFPPLVALGASVTLQSKSSNKELDLAQLVLSPYLTRANPDQTLTSIRFPKLPPSARSAFLKLGRRNALSISRLSVAAILQFGADGRIAEARVVPGAAFSAWRRITEAEQILIGEKPSSKLFAAAGQKASEQMIKETGRRWSTEYKEPVLAVLVRRALEQCAYYPGRPNVMPAPPSSLRSLGRRAEGEATRKPSGQLTVTANINGRTVTITTSANRTLLDLLRDHLGLTGTKCGCEIGECGACTVLIDGQPVNSCLVLAPQIHGREVLTVEGLAKNGSLHPLQQSFMDHDAVHCGFCTPGMLMSAKALLDRNPGADQAEIRTAISGNLCRCTGYQQIVEAIASAKPPRP